MTDLLRSHSTYASEAEQRSYAARLANIDEATMAWFSGWLCADGSIKRHSEKAPKISFTITDLDPLDRFSEIFGGKVNGPFPATGLGVKDRYHWQVSGWKAAAIIERCRPWLSVRYTERADMALNSWRPRLHRGQKLNPEQVADIKRRLACGHRGIGRQLAREYGVSDALISAVRVGRLWPEVKAS